MGLVLITHDRPEPALHGAVAGAVAARIGGRLMHLGAHFDTVREPDALQHVTADGALVASGLVFAERLGAADAVARPAQIAAIAAAVAAGEVVVVPVGPGVDGDAVAALAAAAGSGRTTRLTVRADGDSFVPVGEDGAAATGFGRWRRDDHGRLGAAEDAGAAAGAPLTIAIVGSEHDHRAVYPAALLSLADAAEAAGRVLVPRFLAPQALDAAAMRAAVATVAGVLLPGGSDMANVAGQIAAAHAAIDGGVPIVGLCLGMQSMATAVAQRALGEPRANLPEADPDAPVKTFEPMAADLSIHRLGDRPSRTLPGSLAARLFGDGAVVRCNHRYRLAPAMEAPLAGAGLVVTMRGEEGTIADAVELAGHPFFAGMQGHPELSSRRGAPHPLLAAFVAAAARRPGPG